MPTWVPIQIEDDLTVYQDAESPGSKAGKSVARCNACKQSFETYWDNASGDERNRQWSCEAHLRASIRAHAKDCNRFTLPWSDPQSDPVGDVRRQVFDSFGVEAIRENGLPAMWFESFPGDLEKAIELYGPHDSARSRQGYFRAAEEGHSLPPGSDLRNASDGRENPAG